MGKCVNCGTCVAGVMPGEKFIRETDYVLEIVQTGAEPK